MNTIVEVKPLERFRVWVRFAGGAEGVVDLSDLAGKGVFSAWEDEKIFKSVFVDRESGTIAWPGGIDLCPDTIYATILGIDPVNFLKHPLPAVSR